MNAKMKQKNITKELGYSSSSLQCWRNDIKMQPPYNSNNPKRSQKTYSHLERRQMTSKDANEVHEAVSKKVNTKNSLRVIVPNDKHNHGNILLEQAFSSRINGRIRKNYWKRSEGTNWNIKNHWNI